MILHPGLVEHPKYIELKTKVGDRALEFLVRLWGHCQQNQRGGFWPGVNGDYVEVVCCGRLSAKRLAFEALKVCGWIHERDGGISIHDWDEHNAALVARWAREAEAAQNRAQRYVNGSANRSAQVAAQVSAQNSAQPTIGSDRIGVDRSTEEKKKKGGGWVDDGAAKLKTQFAALNAEIKEEASRLEDMTASERVAHRKKRALLKAIQKKQAAGDFSPMEGGEA